MQSNNNPNFVKCKICQENIPVYQMFFHQNECRQNHPDYVSIIQSRDQSRLQQNQSRVQQNQPQQQQSQSKVVQNSQQVVSEINPSDISEKLFISDRRNPNVPMQSQTQAQRNAAQYTQSLLNNSSTKCEYCNDEYPNELLEEHYKCCEGLIALQQFNDDENQILDEVYNNPQSQFQQHDRQQQQTQNQQYSFSQPDREQQQQTQNYYQQQQRHFQQQQQQQQQQNQNPYYQNQSNIQQHNPYYQNQSNIQQHNNSTYLRQSHQRNNNFSIRTTERMLPGGDIERKVEKINLETGQIQTTVEIIQRNQRNVNDNFNTFSQVSNNNQEQSIQSFFTFGPQRNVMFGPMNLLNLLFSNLSVRNKEDVFKNLAVIKFTPYNNLEPEYKQCSICFCDYEDGEELILLPCLHRFHSECLKKWFNEQTTCPICKLDVAEQEMQYEQGDDEDV